MSWMDHPDKRDGEARDKIQRETGLRMPPLWARNLLAEMADKQGFLAKFVLEENATEALSMLFRGHVISRYVELITAQTPVDDIRPPLFRVMVRLTHTANDTKYSGETPDRAWTSLWAVLRETLEGVEDGADYFCAWFYQKQEELFYPEPPFERFAPFAYMDGDTVVDRFPGYMEAMANAAKAASEIVAKQKASKRGRFRR